MSNKATITEAIGNGISQRLKLVNTAIPGSFLKFDPNTQLAEIQVSIERIDKDGNSSKWSPLIECPVQFPGCDFVLEYQIDEGAEGIVIFSQRCIDAWMDQGGIAPQSRIQFHDINDAMFIPGLRSQPNKIQSFSNNGMRIRNKDGSRYMWLKNDNTGEITVDTLLVNGNIVHNGDTNQTGNTTSTGTVTAQTSVVSPSIIGNGKELSDHDHNYTWTDPAGSGVTGDNN